MATFLKRQTIWTFNHNRNILTTMTSLLYYDDCDGWSKKSNRNNNHHRRFNKNNIFCSRTASNTTVRYASSSNSNGSKKQQKFIYTSQKGDTAGHMVGSSSESPIRHDIKKTYSNFTNQWLEETGQSWPSKCSTKGCCNEPGVGAHIFISKKENAYLIPMCYKCNNNRNNFNYKPNEILDNHLKFPIPLDDGIPCVELTHLHISEQNKYANNVSPTWSEMLERFIAYNKKHNSPLVPYRYNNDPQLGRWVSNQRRSYKRDGLHPGQIELLESNGFVWDVLEHEWDENFQLLIEYKDREGHCKVPQNHKIDGANLGRWCSRQCYNKNRGTLDNVKEKQLNELGMVLDRYEFEWSENIKILIEYKEREGHCNVPYSHKEDGANLGLWLSRQRHCKKIGTLDIVKEKQLEELGTVWDAFEHEWDENIKLLIKYKDKEGNCNVPYNHKEEGANLGRWLIHQRYFKKRGTLDAVKEKQLEELGIVWNVNEHGWDEFSKLLIEYKHREGHCKVPRDHKEDGKNLGKWYSRQKYGKLSEVRQERLREISVIRDDPRTGTE